MRRNPRPYRSIDRRRLAMDIIEREARATAMASRGAMEGALGRGQPGVLTLNKSPVLARLIEETRNEDPAHPRVYDRAHRRHNRS